MALRANEKSIEIISRVRSHVPARVVADPARFRQILVNLVGNAVKFTHAGYVNILMEMGGSAESPTLALTIQDTGIGIPSEKHSQLFEQFVQADASTTRKYGGTGLGLAICRRLLDLMGGTIRFDSEPGAGTTFRFEMPFQAVEEDRAGTRIIPAAKGTRCLIVSPVEPQRLALEETLGEAGILTDAVDGETAAVHRILEATASQPHHHLVLIDDAGGVNPFALAARIRRLSPNSSLRILALSKTRYHRFDEHAASDPEVDGVLRKPLRNSELVKEITRLLGGSTEKENSNGHAASFPAAELPLRVLVAEDNPVNQKLATRVLEKFGCRVEMAVDGKQAVEKWRESGYDLILMDCQMPELDGYEATAVIRRLEESLGKPRTPIVAMTANALDGDREKCLSAGMDDFLSKPVQIEKLHQALLRWS
jgi:CheY-like chemotaxis protein